MAGLVSVDRLAALVAPHASVVRDGTPREVPVAEVVVGDLVRIMAGDQVTADGTLLQSKALALDESNLTGESEPVLRDVADQVLSGSFVVEGAGAFAATAVGADSRAAQLAATARAFRHPRSPLERSMDRLLVVLVGVMAPLGIALGVSLAIRGVSRSQATETLTAAVVNIVPEGLILLVSLTAAVSAAKIARRGVLAQQLNAIESLASVSVMCTDKTGTLTEAALRVLALIPGDGVTDHELETMFGRYAASSSARNSTLQAIHNAELTGDGDASAVTPSAQVPFSSRRRWSALQLSSDRLVLGAPEALLERDGKLGQRALKQARLAICAGHRHADGTLGV
ncbi:MAG: HAD-IC family P-type ATPase [Solirubrobacteraceae bacterium]